MPERLSLENLENVFTYKTPTAHQVAAFQHVRDSLIEAARTILLYVPDCADRSIALRKLREARMDANAAISLEGLI